MVYNLNDWPEGHVGHLVPSEEVINAFIELNKTLPIKSVLEFGFNTGWSTYIILKTLSALKTTKIITRTIAQPNIISPKSASTPICFALPAPPIRAQME